MIEHPCTPDDLFEVMRLILPDAEARAVAYRAFLPIGPDGNVAPPGTPSIVEGIVYTEDTLILLSLLSTESNARVERYVTQTRGRPRDAAEQEQWDRRRAELKAWREAEMRKLAP